jgi:hypothetical protein
VLARVAETDTRVGALVRPGDTAFGEADVPVVGRRVERVRRAVGPAGVIHVRVDAAGDCAAPLAALDRKGCRATVKARMTRDGALARARQRQTRASVERPRLHRAGVFDRRHLLGRGRGGAALRRARAGIEPPIGEWKGAWGIGQVPSRGFDANHATLLLKLLAHDLLRRHHVLRAAPALQRWRAPWLRRALAAVPGRLARSDRCWTPRRAPRPMLN